MKTYFIDFTIQHFDGTSVPSNTFFTISQSSDFARSILEVDLILLEGLLPDNLSVVYDLTKIYCYEK